MHTYVGREVGYVLRLAAGTVGSLGLIVLLAGSAQAAGGLFEVVDAHRQVVGAQLPGFALREVGGLTVALPLLGKAPAFDCEGALLIYTDAACQTAPQLSAADDPPLAHRAAVVCGESGPETAYYTTGQGVAATIVAAGGPTGCYAIDPAPFTVAPAGRLDLRQFAAPLALVDQPGKKGGRER